MSPATAPGTAMAASRSRKPSRPRAVRQAPVSALAAVVALAAVAGALGGALATAVSDMSPATRSRRHANNLALEASVARIDADILALKASVEQTSKIGMTPVQQDQRPPRQGREGAGRTGRQTRQAQRGRRQAPRRASRRLPRPPPRRAPRAKDVTGSIRRLQRPRRAGSAARAKPEVARLPTVEGWVLRDVGNGSALIEGRQGMFEVYAGDPVPASAASTPSASRMAAGWSSPARA